jgi:hypothetical protein
MIYAEDINIGLPSRRADTSAGVIRRLKAYTRRRKWRVIVWRPSIFIGSRQDNMALSAGCYDIRGA